MIGFNDIFYKDLFYSLDNNSVLMQVEPDGRYFPIWCSKEFTDMMEGTSEEFIRLESGGTMNTVHPSDREEVAYLFKHHITKSGTNHLHVRKQTMKGSWIWVCIHYSFIKYWDKMYAYCTYFDITEIKESQKQTQAMYDELNEEMHTLADNSLATLRVNLSTGLVEDVRGRDLYFTDRIGEKLENVIRSRHDNIVLESDKKKFGHIFSSRNITEKSAAGEQMPPVVIFSRRQSGRQCFIKYAISTRKDPVTGDMIAFLAETEYNAEKVTEVLNSKVLAKQYDMVSYIVNGSYGVVIGDRSNIKRGNIFPKHKNGSYTEYILDQVIPSASSKEHSKEELLEALSAETVEKKLSENESYTVDVTCDIEGDIYNKRFVFYAVDSEAKFYIVLKSDITDVIREQRKQNEALALALDEAKQANIAKTAFLSNMSHEIRTPMNAIIGLDNIALREKDLSPETRDQLEKINGSAKHLLALINDILDMSRIESGKMVLKQEEFSFSSMIEQINTMISSQCRDKGLDFDFSLKGKFAEYYIGDDMKLKQVIINILGNAVKFTPKGGQVTFTAENVASFDDKSTLRFVMKDTGIGMDSEYLPRLFEPFSQEDGATTNKYGGTGLGMAITKNIVEMMSGNISVTSEKGKGSEFTVNVTLKTSGRTDSDRKPEASARNTKALADLSGKRILLAEDVTINAEIMKKILSMKKMQTDHVENGKLAVDKFTDSPENYYDAVLMDVRMPVMDGLQAASTIRALDRADAKTVPIIAMTANAFDEDVRLSLQAGMTAHLSKPVEPDKLYNTLAELISQ